MWTTKHGNAAQPLLLGLTTGASGALIAFGDLGAPTGESAPQLRVRRQYDRNATVFSFDVIAYADSRNPVLYNAQVQFTAADLASLVPGTYLFEVEGTLNGEPAKFPGSKFPKLRILPSLDG